MSNACQNTRLTCQFAKGKSEGKSEGESKGRGEGVGEEGTAAVSVGDQADGPLSGGSGARR